MNNQNNIIIRQINDDDISRLEDFYKRVWPNNFEYKYPKRLDWKIKNNPFIPEDFGYPLWIAEINGKIVGHTSALIIPYFDQDHTYLASVSVDTVVDNEYRGLGIGQELQLVNRNSNELFVSIGIALINQHIKAKQGNKYGKEVFSLYYIYSLDKAVLNKGIINKIASKNILISKFVRKFHLSDLFVLFIEKILKSKRVKSIKDNILTYKEVVDFDARFDEIWDTCKKRYEFTAERTSKYLNWKYALIPDLKYKKYIIKNNGTNVGVLVFREGDINENNAVLIAELYYICNNLEWFLDTFSFLDSIYKNKNITCINLYTTEEDVLNSAKQFGYKHIHSVFPMYYSRNVNKIYDKLKTLITRGESDLDQLGLLKQPSLSQIIKYITKIRR